MTITVNGIEELKALAGQTIGPSDWREVTQEMINAFAEIGDCVKMTGNAPQPTYEKLPCAENRHNYTVTKVVSSSSDKCGSLADGYVHDLDAMAAEGDPSAAPRQQLATSARNLVPCRGTNVSRTGRGRPCPSPRRRSRSRA
mgnify:CR=1 FL=1